MYTKTSTWMESGGEQHNMPPNDRSSVRFLESCSSTFTTEFLWLASSWITGQESFIVLEKEILEFSLGGFVTESLGVCDNGFSDGLSDSDDLGHGTSTSDSDSDGEILESISSEDEDWLINLQSHGCWLNKINWLSIDSEDTGSFLAESNSGCVLFLSESSNLLLIFTHFFLDMMHKLNVLIT